MSWYSFTVTKNQISNGSLSSIFDSLQQSLINSGAPKNARLASIRCPDTGSVTYYLSQEMYAISTKYILSFNPQSCNAPDLSVLSTELLSE